MLSARPCLPALSQTVLAFVLVGYMSAGLLPRVSYCIPDLVGLRLAMCYSS